MNELMEAAARAIGRELTHELSRGPLVRQFDAVAMAQAALTAAGVPELLAENQRLREALRTVMRETGTSSLAHHAARDALASLDLP